MRRTVSIERADIFLGLGNDAVKHVGEGSFELTISRILLRTLKRNDPNEGPDIEVADLKLEGSLSLRSLVSENQKTLDEIRRRAASGGVRCNVTAVAKHSRQDEIKSFEGILDFNHAGSLDGIMGGLTASHPVLIGTHRCDQQTPDFKIM